MQIAWKELFIAFGLALLLWYGISGSEKFESQIEVRVDYRGLPSNLVVTDGQVNKLDVRVRAASGQLRSITNSDYRCSIDLSGVTEGENVLPVTVGQLPFMSGVEVVDISPPRVVLTVDALVKKAVPLELDIANRRSQQNQVEVAVIPNEIEISGARAIIDKIHKVDVPFAFSEQYPLGTTDQTKVLPLPEGVISSTNEAIIRVVTTAKQVLVKVTKPVELPSGGTEYDIIATPEKVVLSLMVPENKTQDIEKKSNLVVSASLDRPFKIGNVTIPLQVSLPEGIHLVKIEPKSISLSIKKKASTQKN